MKSEKRAKKESPSLKMSKFGILKCDFFLRILFNILEEKKRLLIVKKNKVLLKRLKLKIEDYIDYQTRVDNKKPIIIEIIPKKDKSGNFINILDAVKNDSFFHIYFNDNKEEEKTVNGRKIVCLEKTGKIKKIKVIIEPQVMSIYKLFWYCKVIESIKFIKFKRKNIDKMNEMFYYCTSLKEIDFFDFNTDNVTDMSYMFDNCSSL